MTVLIEREHVAGRWVSNSLSPLHGKNSRKGVDRNSLKYPFSRIKS
jgi:hypothetical protein